MTRYVVLVVNNDGGAPAHIFDDLETAIQWAFQWCIDPEKEPPLDHEERLRLMRDLQQIDGSEVQSVGGSDAWKEWIYIAPVSERGSR